MIAMILRISWLNLKRDRTALMLTFILPLLFFSVFALVFGAMDRPDLRPLDTAVVVEQDNPIGQRLRQVIAASPQVRLVELPDMPRPIDGHALRQYVREGSAQVVIAVPQGFHLPLGRPNGGRPTVWVCANESHPMAAALAEGLIQSAALTLALESAGVLEPGSAPSQPAVRGLVGVETLPALAGGGKKPSIAYFAAGIGVMFLLFSVSGRSALLIEERETGVLMRLMASRLTVTQFLLGRWSFLVLLGSVQVVCMFVWAALAFGLDLWTVPHLAGLIVMTITSAAAAAALGVLLAVSCRTRAQLNGVATVVILIMSVLGGSLFPRFLMPEQMQWLGRFTFNAWALDGFQKVFWYEASPAALWVEMTVLGMTAAATLFLAVRIAAQRIARGGLR